MCGIAGVCFRPGFVPSAAESKKLSKAMLASLAHRGPDGNGIFAHENLLLVQARLSIIDVEAGKQPFVEKVGNAPVALVANGEIYNYKDLQEDLADARISCRTGSDCEPPLHLYLREGAAMVDTLRGMFGLAVADGRDGSILLARDPFGIKPLYYAATERGVMFSSEIRTFWQTGWLPPEVNMDVLPEILAGHHVRGSLVPMRGIRRVLPGERLTLNDGGIAAKERRFPLPTNGQSLVDLGFEEALETFDGLLAESIRRHVQSDVPFGVYLSGGVDSSVIAVAMAKQGIPLRTFCMGFEAAGTASVAPAEELARKLGANHTTLMFGEADFWRLLDEMAFALDDLATDAAALPTLMLSAEARKHVKVVLTGEGGDEIFGGYKSYRLNPLLAWWKGQRGGDAWAYRVLFQPGFARVAAGVEVPWSTRGYSRMQVRQARDVAEWLPHDLLLKCDRTLMLHGLEGRVPLLDDDLARWGFHLPDRLKVGVKDGKPYGKFLLRAWLAREGQAHLAWNRKQGFSVPVGRWLAARPDTVRGDIEGSALLREVLVAGAVDTLLAEASTHAKAGNLLFTLLMLARWERRIIG